MAANISVIGTMDNGMGGLKESLTKFRKHHAEVGDALLNISGVETATGEKVDKDEPRPAYQHQAWPKMVYHADGREEIVEDEAALKAIVAKGFRKEPYPKPQVYVADAQTEKKALMDQNAELRAMQARLLERLEALENKK